MFSKIFFTKKLVGSILIFWPKIFDPVLLNLISFTKWFGPKESCKSQFPAIFLRETTASDWPSSPWKDGWNYFVDCLANQRWLCSSGNWRETDSYSSLLFVMIFCQNLCCNIPCLFLSLNSGGMDEMTTGLAIIILTLGWPFWIQKRFLDQIFLGPKISVHKHHYHCQSTVYGDQLQRQPLVPK